MLSLPCRAKLGLNLALVVYILNKPASNPLLAGRALKNKISSLKHKQILCLRARTPTLVLRARTPTLGLKARTLPPWV